MIAKPGARHPSVDIGGCQQGLNQAADNPGEDQSDKEDQPRSEQAGEEVEDVVGQLIDRSEDLGDPEIAERGHDPDQPDDQLCDRPQLVADGLMLIARRMLLERGRA